MYRRSMSAFQFVSLLPTYHLVNGQTSDQANWAHGRRPEASSSRVLKNPSGLGETGVQAVTRDSRTARKLFKKALSHPPTPRAPRRTPFPYQGRNEFSIRSLSAPRFTLHGFQERCENAAPGKARLGAQGSGG